ncbi:helix-turn-helix domain-containing protein [Nocardia sp.]|uniref:helix-turn-helix domain-containing protein n=1 Tax=Nocardia sp. TaxID=1821 RepID=UPI00345112F9
MDRGNVNRAFGKALSVRREAAELSRAQFWARLGWGRNTYQRTEDGLREASIADLIEASTALNIPPGELLDEVLRRLATGDYPQPSPGRELRRQLGM